MELLTLFLFGCLIGMQHALEADHLAAVAALSDKRGSRRALVLRGSVWGIGHTITLLTICGVILLLGESISARTEAILEAAVGAMVILLGGNVLYKVWRDRPHIHVHHHENGTPHIHVHRHADERVAHEQNPHVHRHQKLGLGRALLVGMMHGAAGSAGLLVLAAAADSLQQAGAYVIAFGAGSIIGMAALSFIVSFPMRKMESCASWVNTSAFVSIGCAAIIIGGNLIRQSWSSL
jgi:ABC-type nickel/cobalt efflux system permease component RcnA